MTRIALPAALAAACLVAAPVSAADVNLTMYYPVAVGGPLTKVIDDLVAGFEAENPSVDVTAVYAGNYDDARVRALSALNSGEPAQLAVMFSIDAYDLLERDLIVPFDEIATSDADKAWLESFYPALMANGEIEGHVWGIPFQRSTIVMYYNKDMFEAAGIDAAPETWDQTIEAAKALTHDDVYGLMVPSTGYPYWMFQAFAIQQGVELMARDGLSTNFDAPEAIKALQLWRDLAVEYKVMPEGVIEWGTLRQAFLQGQTAMMWHSTGNLTAVKNGAEFEFGVAMLPKETRFGSPTGGGNFYIFKDATEAERAASMDLIKYMTAPERAAEWSIATGYVGVSPAAYETQALKTYAQEFPQAVVARDQLDYAIPEFSTFETARVREVLSNAVQAALTGAKTPEQALTEAQAQADRLLQPYR